MLKIIIIITYYIINNSYSGEKEWGSGAPFPEIKSQFWDYSVISNLSLGISLFCLLFFSSL